MYTRYDVRNACSRIAKGLEPRNPDIKPILMEKMSETNFNWSQFGTKWDAVVTEGNISFITAIKDLDEVKDICTRRQMIEELGVEKSWNERETAIIDAMETQFLDGIMNWNNYNKSWGVKMDTDRGSVVTFLTKIKPSQISQAEIDKKLQEMMKPTEESAPKGEHVLTLDMDNAKPLTDEQAKQFDLDKEIKRMLDK